MKDFSISVFSALPLFRTFQISGSDFFSQNSESTPSVPMSLIFSIEILLETYSFTNDLIFASEFSLSQRSKTCLSFQFQLYCSQIPKFNFSTKVYI